MPCPDPHQPSEEFERSARRASAAVRPGTGTACCVAPRRCWLRRPSPRAAPGPRQWRPPPVHPPTPRCGPRPTEGLEHGQPGIGHPRSRGWVRSGGVGCHTRCQPGDRCGPAEGGPCRPGRPGRHAETEPLGSALSRGYRRIDLVTGQTQEDRRQTGSLLGQIRHDQLPQLTGQPGGTAKPVVRSRELGVAPRPSRPPSRPRELPSPRSMPSRRHRRLPLLQKRTGPDSSPLSSRVRPRTPALRGLLAPARPARTTPRSPPRGPRLSPDPLNHTCSGFLPFPGCPSCGVPLPLTLALATILRGFHLAVSRPPPGPAATSVAGQRALVAGAPCERAAAITWLADRGLRRRTGGSDGGPEGSDGGPGAQPADRGLSRRAARLPLRPLPTRPGGRPGSRNLHPWC